MKKAFLLITLFLCGCAASPSNTGVVELISYEKYSDLYINNELVGISHTQAQLPYKGIKETKLSAKKDGCEPVEVNAVYEFDSPMLLNPFNLLYVPEKYFSWDWWRPAKSKHTYYLTPICKTK